MVLHIDHVIILVPYSWLLNPPSWVTENFTLSPGGRHADNKTENRLVVFQDGFYIEFISFINDDPAHRQGHWWGKKKFGIIDFAFTTQDSDAPTLFSQLEERLAKLELGTEAPEVKYQQPALGGRKRPDGVEIAWNVTFPVVDAGYQRGELPFFCQDLTPRELRVPISEASTDHPNKAFGIDELYIFAPEGRAQALAQAYHAILDVPNSVSDSDPDFVGQFETKRLFDVEKTDGPVVVIGVPFEEDQKSAMEERGGVLLANLTFGSAREGTVLKRIDVGDDSLGGIFAPVI